jgi:tRNA modification GTPase
MIDLSSAQDTIFALATPPGIGAIGVIRISGSQAFTIINKLFAKKDLNSVKTHTLHVGFLEFDGHILDEVVLSVFKGPHSYTGEDIVEISCHGSLYIQQRVMDALALCGARLAMPGEFTQRAFLNNKMDLAQAESVADIIASNSEAAQQAALKQLRGGFSNELKSLREELIKLAALVELELDFSEEDVEFVDRKDLRTLVDRIYFYSNSLLDSFKLGNVIKNGVSVAIIGKPNAGKSTLLNALLNEERAIVSDIPGTTRDTIEEALNIDGILFRLIDTAGIRSDTSDIIETFGVEKSIEKMRSADIVIYLFDASKETTNSINEKLAELKTEHINFILVANKMDLLIDNSLPFTISDEIPLINISANNKSDIDAVKKALFDNTVHGDIKQENTIVTNARHQSALNKVVEALNDIKAGMDQNISGDLLAPDIRKALHFLGEITGDVEVDRDILGTIFSKFCIGK